MAEVSRNQDGGEGSNPSLSSPTTACNHRGNPAHLNGGAVRTAKALTVPPPRVGEAVEVSWGGWRRAKVARPVVGRWLFVIIDGEEETGECAFILGNEGLSWRRLPSERHEFCSGWSWGVMTNGFEALGCGFRGWVANASGAHVTVADRRTFDEARAAIVARLPDFIPEIRDAAGGVVANPEPEEPAYLDPEVAARSLAVVPEAPAGALNGAMEHFVGAWRRRRAVEQEVRGALSRVIREILEAHEEEWDRAVDANPDTDPATIAEFKSMHDAQTFALIEAIGGAL